MSAPEEIKKAKEDMLNKLKETELYKKVEAEIKDKVGANQRPLVVNTDVLQKLYEAFIIGASDEEACFWANISPGTLYNFQNKYPEFLELKEQWKENPVMKARNTIFKNLSNPMTASWYLERKRKAEFATRSEITGAEGERLLPDVIEELNKTRYDKLADRITAFTSGQSVEAVPPVQNQGQAGETSNVPPEPDSTKTS